MEEKSEERYRHLVEGSHELIQSIAPDGRIIFVNASWKKTLGYTDDEIAGLTVFDIIAQEYITQYKKEFATLLQGTEVMHRELVFVAKNGRRIFVDGSCAAWMKNGKVLCINGFFRDITDRRVAGEELMKTQANLEALFKSSAIGYLLMDTAMKIISYNTIMKDWVLDETGYNLEKGLNYVDLLEGERKRRARSAFERALEGEKIEYEADGSTDAWFFISISPISWDNKGIIGISVTCINITERKKAELELHKMANEIIQRNKDLEQFAYIISHNLRSPLSNIVGATNVMRYEDINPEDKERLLQGIYISVKKLDEVVMDLNNILQVNRDISEKKQEVVLSDLVEDIKLSINHLIVNENVLLKTDFGEVGRVFTLRSYFYSILYNLISNSIKYRRPDVQPEIQIYSRKLQNGFLIKLRDNGMGIDMKKNEDKIFGLYKRFHAGIEGKGMGLFMVKTQVETLGGKITIDSAVDKGTEFTITFEH